MTTPEALEAQTSRLLAFPGEIRNRIYDIAISDVLYKATLPGLAHPQRKAYSMQETQGLTRNWRMFRRSFLGLTQTCRQLRDEFLPIHQARIPMAISLTELEEYAAVFLVPLKVGNIRVEVACKIQVADIRNVLLQCLGAPFISVEVRWKMQKKLQRMNLNPYKHPPLLDYIAEKVDRVAVVPGLRWDVTVGMHLPIIWLHLYVKSEFVQAWMKKHLASNDREDLRNWWTELGIPRGIYVLPICKQSDIRHY